MLFIFIQKLKFIYENDNKCYKVEVYNKGLKKPPMILLYSYDDSIINTTNIGNKIIKIIRKFDDYGIIGKRGTTIS